MILLRPSEVCELLGVNQRQLGFLIEGGVVTPAMPGGGKGRHRAYSIRDVLALGAFLSFRNAESSVPHARAAAAWVSSQSLDSIRKQIDAGKTKLVVGQKSALGDLVSDDELPALLMGAQIKSVAVAVLNVAKALAELMRRVEKIQAERNREKAETVSR